MTTGELHFEDLPCLFCATPDDSELYPASFGTESFSAETFSARRSSTREHYRLVRCRQCGLVRSTPVLCESELNRLYKESSFTFPAEAPFAAAAYAELLRSLLARHRVTGSSLLELGSSTGFFLEAAISLGFTRIIGFEPSRDCYNYATPAVRSRMINDIFLPELLAGETFDIACCFQVIDHLMHPGETIRALADTLASGGCLFLACHDVDSISAKILGRNSPVFDIEHIYLFSRKTLGRLCREAGLTVLETGSLANSYPLGYWLRMLSLTRPLKRFLPEAFLRVPLKLKAGNLYLFARKDDTSC